MESHRLRANGSSGCWRSFGHELWIGHAQRGSERGVVVRKQKKTDARGRPAPAPFAAGEAVFRGSGYRLLPSGMPGKLFAAPTQAGLLSGFR